MQMPPAFTVSGSFQSTRRTYSPCSARCSAERPLPHVVVLPGLDGSPALLDAFRATLLARDATRLVIPVTFPRKNYLSFDALGSLVMEKHLEPLMKDPRGYIVVSQSYSAHVAFRLGSALDGLRGHVFVNGFASPPVPKFVRMLAERLWVLPHTLFERPPPEWIAGPLFLGTGGNGIKTVQREGVLVGGDVMSKRLADCLQEDSWHRWRCSSAVPRGRCLYLCGGGDPIVGTTMLAKDMRAARDDVKWVTVKDGPHLLLQRFGAICAREVDSFCERLGGPVNGRVK